jgi:peptidoglycan-N-acetylglucosamine deacetylase
LNTNQVIAKNIANNPFLVINDKLYRIPFEVKNDALYMPIEYFQTHLGAEISLSQDIVITKHKSITINVGEKYLINEFDKTIPIDIYTNDNYLMLPIEVAKYLDYEISYINSGAIVRVRDKDSLLSDDEVYNTNKDYIQKELKILEEKRLEEQRKLDEQKKIEEAKNKKVIYLTFDDGPNKYTPQILDTLKKYNMKATFFTLSGNMNANKSIVQRIIKEGHAIGLHGVTHDVKKVYASKNSILNEMNISNSTLNSLIGQVSNLIRAPYGSKPHLSKEQLETLELSGYKLWDWNIDSGDSKSLKVTSEEIYTTTIHGIQKQKLPVVLFHDRQSTTEALPKILEYLKQNNYEPKILTPDVVPVNFWR